MAVMKFKLMVGGHSGPDDKGVVRDYHAGDDKRNVITTTQDLSKLNGDVPPKKFELLDKAGAVVSARAKVVDFDEMTLPELKSFSEEEELGVDFNKVKTPEEGRKAVRAARKQLQTA